MFHLHSWAGRMLEGRPVNAFKKAAHSLSSAEENSMRERCLLGLKVKDVLQK